MRVLAWLDPAAEVIDRWSEWAARRLFTVSVYVMLPSLVALVTLDVALRYLFNPCSGDATSTGSSCS